MKTSGRLVVVSNRTPPLSAPSTEEEQRVQPVGGLVTSVRSALERRGGIWFGWTGRTNAGRPFSEPAITTLGPIQLVTLDLPRDDVRLSYGLFANRTLWPLLHSYPARVVIRHDAYRAYRRVNRRFAEALSPMLEDGDLVWVQDYHLIPLGQELRQLGWKGKIGYFLHTPFPPAETFAILPWARPLAESLLAYDLIGVHTSRYEFNLIDTLVTELGGSATGGSYARGQDTVRAAVHPIGIDAALFEGWANAAATEPVEALLPQISPRQRVILGVDRLDYTKGVPARLRVFEHVLEHNPSLRGKVVMVQISAPSRSRIPEYMEETAEVDQLVGRINGRFSEAGWMPVHYLYRSYSQRELAGFFRQADICLVTPLRDGMNLIAKEFVASQGPDPGVLVLSKFCGAADTMPEALIVNPYDIEEVSSAICRGLSMPVKERRSRRETLMEGVRRHTAETWGETFLAALVAT